MFKVTEHLGDAFVRRLGDPRAHRQRVLNRRSVGVHVQRAEIVGQRGVEVDPALLDEAHHQCGGECLADAGDREHIVRSGNTAIWPVDPSGTRPDALWRHDRRDGIGQAAVDRLVEHALQRRRRRGVNLIGGYRPKQCSSSRSRRRKTRI
jgi:hypothetical protein